MKKLLVILCLLGPKWGYAAEPLPHTTEWPNGKIYYTVPGGINLVVPWSAAIAGGGYDFVSREELTTGYVPLGQYSRLTAVLGGGLNTKGQGSPLAGAMFTVAQGEVAQIPLVVILSGGYNINAGHALAVLSLNAKIL
jgi:hypothetical protein